MGVVLADRGFNISDLVGMIHARLYLGFTKGKDQLSPLRLKKPILLCKYTHPW